MAELREFQRRTVEYVSARFWGSAESTERFLIADEVGLGKTLVARGIVAHGLEVAQREKRRFRVVYVCANAILADQNKRRLFRDLPFEVHEADRLTNLANDLPAQEAGASAVAFTPLTSFRFTRRLGEARERALLLTACMAARWPRASKTAAKNVFQGTVRDHRTFRRYVSEARAGRAVDSRIVDALEALRSDDSGGLVPQFRRLLSKYPRANSRGDWDARANFVADLRKFVARAVLRELSPDLVILDEFQKFRYLIKPPLEQGAPPASELDEHEIAARELAGELLQTGARVLLMSATPFKPYTCEEEQADHWSDFSEVMSFLLPPERLGELQAALERRRTALGRDCETARAARQDAERVMRLVVSRFERVGATGDGNAMLITPPATLELAGDDARDALFWIRLARRVGSREPISLWESAPYGLHFLEGYELDRRVRESTSTKTRRADLRRELMGNHFARLPSADKLARYERVCDSHPALRWLINDTVRRGWWRLPWVPPSLPYWKLSGAYEACGDVSKRLVFSAWRAVPRSIAPLVSYAAEQIAASQASVQVPSFAGEDGAYAERDDEEQWWRSARTKHRSTVRAFRAGEEAVWSTLAISYPSRFLAQIGLDLARARVDVPDVGALVAAAAECIRPMLAEFTSRPGATPDARWYGVLPVLLDARMDEEILRSEPPGDLDEGVVQIARLSALVEQVRSELGPKPADLAKTMAHLAIASPAICARRALARGFSRTLSGHDLTHAAARIGVAIVRYLEKRPHVVALRADYPGVPLWRAIMARSADGCLQAAMDEQVHLLCTDEMDLGEVVSEIVEGLELRSAVVAAAPVRHTHPESDDAHFHFRTHFAVRFGSGESIEGGEEEKEVERLRRVRCAFNGPWWPMIVVTTSFGQEGLDFHRWCNRVVHWNLPWNPVDLEQREGRVHRFRNLAVRRNVAYAKRSALGALTGDDDPWQAMFKAIPHDRDGMVPDWLFLEGPARIERAVPLLPMTRERVRLDDLRAALSVYRALLGQPRQEDILSRLASAELQTLRDDHFNLEPRSDGPGADGGGQ